MKKMSKFIKNNFKGIIIGTIIGILLCGTIGVMAITYFPSNDVTYDNKESGLSSTNVQGAIDELYNSCFPEPDIPDIGGQKPEIVTEGDGLYEDEYEEGRYIYKGANPNNYITFSGETWRIISIEPDNTIKIMYNNLLTRRAWGNTNDWNSSGIKTYLNSTYYNTLSDKDKIINHKWSIGMAKFDNYDLLAQIQSENSETWTGKVGLITASEYIRANSNKVPGECGLWIANNDNHSSCKETNWMFNSQDEWWTITKNEGSAYVANATRNGYLGQTVSSANYSEGSHGLMRPVVYLSSNITLSGSGTSQDPYTIE